MPIDPRTPVIVGVGQVVNRPIVADLTTRTQPVALMVEALRLAGLDATRRVEERSALLEQLDELTAIPSFVWRAHDPARAVAEGLGIHVARTRVAFAGGTAPQTLLFDAARRIAVGDLEVAAVVGGEAIRSRDLARKHHEPVEWFEQGEDVAAANVVGEVPDALTDHERAVGLTVPVHTYALLEHARRHAHGLTRADHLDQLGRLAARMSEVAASNERAWIRDGRSAESVTTPASDNRMVSFPYTKLLTSNVIVDMGAAVIVCSLEAARAARVPDDQMVFPQIGAHAKEQWFVSERLELSRSIAMHACARGVLGEGAGRADGIALFDIYSCFPAVVQMAGDALGIDLWGDPRPPSVTGGMTFFGGPGNNYVTHSIATMVERLRAVPGATGLVTALGWYCSTHAWGTYASAPPVGGFRAVDVQAAVDAEPLRVADDSYAGTGEVESYTVTHDRDGRAARAIVSVRTPAGARRLVGSDDADVAAEVEAADPLGATVAVDGHAITL